MNKINMSPVRSDIMEALKNATEPLTLAEIGAIIHIDNLKSGTINAMVTGGLIEHGEPKTVVCPCCGRKRTLSTYKVAEAQAQ